MDDDERLEFAKHLADARTRLDPMVTAFFDARLEEGFDPAHVLTAVAHILARAHGQYWAAVVPPVAGRAWGIELGTFLQFIGAASADEFTRRRQELARTQPTFVNGPGRPQ